MFHLERNEAKIRKANTPNEIILLKLGETALKGQNKRSFENRLMHSIRTRLGSENFKVYAMQSTIYVEPKKESDLDEAMEKLKKLFGVVYLMKAAVCPKDEDEIAKTAIAYLGDELKKAESFAVKCKRADKSFHLNSPELSSFVGGEILKSGVCRKVSLTEPDFSVELEIRDRAAFVHSAPIKGAGDSGRNGGRGNFSALGASTVRFKLYDGKGLKIYLCTFFPPIPPKWPRKR